MKFECDNCGLPRDGDCVKRCPSCRRETGSRIVDPEDSRQMLLFAGAGAIAAKLSNLTAFAQDVSAKSKRSQKRRKAVTR